MVGVCLEFPAGEHHHLSGVGLESKDFANGSTGRGGSPRCLTEKRHRRVLGKGLMNSADGS